MQSGYKEDKWGNPVSGELAVQLSFARKPEKMVL
jgi:hypothetical protein